MHNPLTKNYIIRPTGVIKEEKVLVGNHYEVTQDWLLAVGKNALQRSGIKTISKQEFKKVTNNIFGKRLFDGRGIRL